MLAPSIVFVIAMLAATSCLLLAVCADKPQQPGPTWFDLLPHLRESQKRKTRAQQTRRHGARRY